MTSAPGGQARIQAIAAYALGGALLASVSLVQACGGNSSSACVPKQDNVTANQPQVSVSNSNLQPQNCQVLATPNVQIVTTSGGMADTQFGDSLQNIGLCVFQQLPPIAPATPKTASFTTRTPVGALFQMYDGQASCTLRGAVEFPLCGQATVFPNQSSFTGLVAMCNSDPFVSVSIYRGGATVRLDKVPGTPKVTIRSNDELTADLKTGWKPVHSVPQFTSDQISLFDVQLDAVMGGVSLTNRNSLLAIPTLSATNVIVAPSMIRYGSLTSMCSQASAVPVLFYPADLKASTPRVLAGVCSHTAARVYGVAVYRQTGLGFSGPYFTDGGGGARIRTDIFKSPITLESGSPTLVFSWDGSIGQAPFPSSAPATPAFAKSDVYVLKFLYDLPPDTTPRVGFMATSLFGAPYPVQIG